MTGADTDAELPEWLRPLADAAAGADPFGSGSARTAQERGGRTPRRSAVLVLFGEQTGDDGVTRPDLLIIERSATLRNHPGQPSFPGGKIDPGDDGPVAAALREAREETGLDPAGVHVFGRLPELYLRPSDFLVTPVLAWWRTPSPVGVVDEREVASVHRVELERFADPANRVRLRHPAGRTGPGFHVAGLLVWGFTAGLIDALLRVGGWERPWDSSLVTDLPAGTLGIGRPSPSLDLPS